MGIRATRLGGTWEVIRGPSPRSTNYFIEEQNAMLAQCSKADAYNLREELYALMNKAERGQCTYGRGSAYDVDHMVCTDLILELRLRCLPRVGSRSKLHVRLYFTEPAHVDGVLYVAKLAWKRGGEYGKHEQTQHARDAEKRVRAFFKAGYGNAGREVQS